MIRRKLEAFMSTRRCTLLGVGPMSRNCVDATIELANEHEVPILMIASRRQIEAKEQGGGYVNQWSTQDFAEYVLERDRKGMVILSRDHGGPWQNTWEVEQKLSLRKAMESAKQSYRVDIESGFEFIHIDPSIDLQGPPKVDDVLMRIFELYEYCWKVAQEKNREIIFEIGTEEQSGTGTNSMAELDYTLAKTREFCVQNGLPAPTFIVVQTGTRTLETKNVGSFDSPFRVANELPAEIQIPKILEVCRKHGIFMKEHNTDYLSDDALSWHPKLGIHAANVAPEFGVAETRALMSVLRENGMGASADEFARISFESGKWKKWMIPGTKATDLDRAVISGHYVFSNPAVVELKAKAQTALSAKGIDLDAHLKTKVKESIYRYLKCFQLLRIDS